MVVEKPPYRIPSMAEIADLEPNGLTVASTFSGAGGSCLGFRMAGYRTVYASEFVPAAGETYRANHPGVPLDDRDVRQVTGDAIREMSGVDEFDVLEGSPPCASFSTAGRRSAHWGESKKYSDVEQRVDDLFFEYVRLVGELRPKVFVAENVSGLVKGVAKGYFKRIHAGFVANGYRVEARMLDAQWLGVPQARQRVIFVGVRNDLGVEPAFPSPLPYRYSIRDALEGIAAVRYDNGSRTGTPSGPDDVDAPIRTISTSHGADHHFQVYDEPDRFPSGAVRQKIGQFEEVADNVAPTLDGYAVGKEWEQLRQGQSSDRFFNLVRPNLDAPVPTVTASGGSAGAGAPGGVASITHPYEKRKFTISELRRLCGFPDDFILTGSYAQQWERLGRAVPPPMMAAVARTIAERVLA